MKLLSMENVNACDDEDSLMERLIRVENALFYLKVKSACGSTTENGEVERLEELRRELHERYAEVHIPSAASAARQESSREMATT